jgi:hypothetical protein
MKKLITIVGLVAAVISTPAFAKSGATKADRQSAPAYLQHDESIVPSSNAYGPNY